VWPYGKQLDRIESLLKGLTAVSTTISVNLSALMAQVAQQLTVEQSAITLINGIAAEIAAAAASGDDAALPALTQQLNTSATALAAAVAANTPAPSAAAATVSSAVVK
jgi:hypothetical protein